MRKSCPRTPAVRGAGRGPSLLSAVPGWRPRFPAGVPAARTSAGRNQRRGVREAWGGTAVHGAFPTRTGPDGTRGGLGHSAPRLTPAAVTCGPAQAPLGEPGSRERTCRRAPPGRRAGRMEARSPSLGLARRPFRPLRPQGAMLPWPRSRRGNRVTGRPPSALPRRAPETHRPGHPAGGSQRRRRPQARRPRPLRVRGQGRGARG